MKRYFILLLAFYFLFVSSPASACTGLVVQDGERVLVGNKIGVRSWLFIFIIQPDAQIATPPGKLLPRPFNHASNSAVIVEDKGPLYRYIHRNPIKAGIATLDDYIWSSHKGYLSIAKKWNWINKSVVLRYLSENKKDWIKKYRQIYGD